MDRKGRPCNYPCPACPRRFAFQCRLAAHLRCHTNIRPFICVDCGRAFTQRGYLVRHAAVHKLDRPFSCGICDRSYKHYGSLVNHRRTHSKLGVGASSALGGNVALLSASAMEHLTCNATGLPTGIGAFSSLEEVVGGSLIERQDKLDSSGTTTITLLPVTKVEEILPGDVGTGSMQQQQQQLCLPSVPCVSSSAGNVITLSDRHHSTEQPSTVAHQLTATAVWPMLGQQTRLMAATTTSQPPPQQQPMLHASHFATLAVSPNQTLSSNSQVTQLSTTPIQRVPRPAPGEGEASSSQPPPTFVTLPVFGTGSSQANSSQQPTTQSDADDGSTGNSGGVTGSSSANNAGGGQQLQSNPHNPFHGGGTNAVVVAAASSDSSATPHHSGAAAPPHPHTHSGGHSSSQPSTAQLQQRIQGDANSTPVLHVLQPSPSIFLPSYYLPHTATPQL